ncbi:MAG: S8 family serine peptidase, partial [Thermomicrobiales bacterium]
MTGITRQLLTRATLTAHLPLRLLVVLGMLLGMLSALVPSAGAAPPPTQTPAVGTATPTPQDGPTVPILVKFKASASSADIDAAVHSAGGQRGRGLTQIHTHVINVPAAARDRVLAAYAKNPLVERASATITVGKASLPNDPGYAQQWALPQIAWNQAYGNVSVSGTATIAVLDTGVDGTHPDLASQVVAGQSFVNGNAGSDPNGHGTALAGIAAASVNNATGMAGVAYAGAKLS